jgi:hypothetical protein
MVITKEVVTRIELDDGSELRKGDNCVFRLKDGYVCTGKFQGVTKRGSFEFASRIGKDIFKFAVMPSSITEIEVWCD